jgi:FAD/FMN-containing dehydrogenase
MFVSGLSGAPGFSRRRFLGGAAGAVAALGLHGRIAAAASAASAKASAIDGLRKTFQGELLEPSDADYLAWSVSTNTRYDSILPLAVALCETPKDVSAAIHWARQENVPLAIRGGGHNYLGMSSTPGLLIVTRRMRRIELEKSSGLLRIEAGAVNGELLNRLGGGEWMLPIGTCPQVGVAGLTLGGGMGDNARWAGLTSDHLRSTTAVLASGEEVEISDQDNPDLFWACRGGGGGNFAIQTSLTFQLLAAPRRVAFFAMEFAGADATIAAYAALQSILAGAPDEFSTFCFLRSSPRAGDTDATPWQLSPAVYPSFQVVGSLVGSEADLRALVAPLSALNPLVPEFGAGSFWEATQWLSSPPGVRHGWADVNRYMNRTLTEAEIAEMVSILLEAPFGRRDRFVEFGLFGWVGGKVATIPAAATAYAHRNGTGLLRAGAIWDFTTPMYDQIALNDWLDKAYAFIARVGTRASYLNWPGDRITDWKTAYYGENLSRLVKVKQSYDPDNLIYHAQSIPVKLD